MNGELPEGWVITTLSEVVELKYGKGLKKSVRLEGNVPVFGSNGKVGQHNIPLSSGPTIVVGRKGSIGAIHFSDVPCWPIDTTYFIDEFKATDPIFLKYALILLRLNELDTSSAIPGLNRNDAYVKSILIPPLSEQKRIVKKVGALLARVNAARERLGRVPALLKRFRQAVLAAACSGRLTGEWREERSYIEWKNITLSELSELITKGSSPNWQGIDYVEKGVLFITSENVGQFKLDLNNRKYVEKRFNEIQRRSILKTGDLLTNIVGASIGRSCIYDLSEKANINQAVCVIRLKPNIDKDFILLTLNSPRIIDQMHKNKVDVARANLSLKDVGDLKILLPSIEEQKEIVRRIEALFKLADTIEARVEAAQVRAEKLTQAILAKAFRGELVPTEAELARREGRDYETAEELLGRVKSQNEHVSNANNKDCY